ncbi:MAG TPA: biotin/lipoyl-containing protein [Pyrinomonadaceae bacterium]|nr:biotin/lipoyl-containing protein [Pyrinomonadaceae bacterium]
MKLTAEISGEKIEIDVRQDGTRVVAEVGGRRYELEGRASASRPGVYLLLLDDGQVYECSVTRPAAGQEAAEVMVGSHAYTIALTDAKRLRGSQSQGGHGGGTSQIVAPMPGKVVRVLVEAGAEVSVGDGLIVVEAMKMQNEMKSPKDGKVTSVNVAAGTTVNAGDVLAVVE